MVAFQSTAPDLVGRGRRTSTRTSRPSRSVPPTEVYERDVVASETILVSVARNGRPGGGRSLQSTVGGNGRFVAFASLVAHARRGRHGTGSPTCSCATCRRCPARRRPAIDFGSLAVGAPGAPPPRPSRNDGWGPLPCAAATIAGAARTDYRVVLADGCNGRTLHRTEACTVTVSFTPSASGCAAGDAGRPVRVRGLAAHEPALGSRQAGTGRPPRAGSTLDPKIGPPGIVIIATGTGFAPGSKVRLTWSVGETPTLPIVQVDATGRFRKQVLVFHNDLTGPRDLVATPLGGGKPASATMLVIRPSVVPPGFLIIRRLIDLPLVLVIRG